MARSAPRSRAPLALGGGASARPRRLLSVDDRLAPPDTRIEYIDGIKYFAAPAHPPHALAHADLAFVLRAHTAPGYRCAVEMLTRTDKTSDFAPDASIYPDGNDPATGKRKLEELAFEVVSKQALRVPTLKASKLIERGVRRMFAILVGKKRVLEWSRTTGGWQPLDGGAVLEDRCLVRPLPVRALLEAAASNESVVEALRAHKEPAMVAALADERRQGKAEGEARGLREGEARGLREGEAKGLREGEARGLREGEARGLRTAIVAICEASGIALTAARRARLAAMGADELAALCRVLSAQRRWPRRGEL